MYVKMFLVSFQSYNSFPLDSVKPTEVLSVIGVKGAKRKNKNFISLYLKFFLQDLHRFSVNDILLLVM